MCVSLFVWGGEGQFDFFSLPICTFAIKRQGKDITSVYSCNSLNSVQL